MNKISYLFGLAIVAMFFHSCEKEQILQNENAETKTPQYWVDEGILNFSSGEAYQKLNDRLTDMNMEEIKAWEDSLGFISFRTEYYRFLDEMESIETKDDLNAILSIYKDIVSLENERIEPKIKQTTYQRTTNRNGLFMINGMLHKVSKSALFIYDHPVYNSLDELIDKTNKPDTWNHKEEFKERVILKSTYCGDTENETSVTVNNKWCFAEYVVDLITNYPTGGIIQRWYEVTCTSYAYKKTLGITALYNSLHACNNLECIVEAPTYNCDCGCYIFNEVTLSLATGYDIVTSSTMKTKAWFDGQIIGGITTNTSIPSPVFKRVKGTFWISGTTNPNPPYDHEDAVINCGYGY